jgi:hypothetical protein
MGIGGRIPPLLDACAPLFRLILPFVLHPRYANAKEFSPRNSLATPARKTIITPAD